jgi:hypothetical protein
MRLTKAALLLFGAALLFGLFVKAAEISELGRIAAAAIALAILLVPAGIAADLWRRLRPRRRRVRKPARKVSRRRPAPVRRRSRSRG